jgi:hypothetical protein
MQALAGVLFAKAVEADDFGVFGRVGVFGHFFHWGLIDVVV